MQFLMLMMLIIVFAAINLFGRIFSTSLLHPIRLIVLFWTLTVLIPVFYWSQQYAFSGFSYFWLAGFLFAMELGAMLCQKTLYIKRKGLREKLQSAIELHLYHTSEKNWVILKAVVILGFVSVAVTLVTQGMSISSVFSVQGILDTNAQYSAIRSEGVGRRQTIMSLALSLFIYLSAICGGYCYNCALEDERSNKIWCIVSVLPAILLTLMTSGKSGTIASFMFWTCGWCVSRLSVYGALPHLPVKTIIKIGFGILLLFLFLYMAMLLRVGSFTANSRLAILNKFFVYAFGQTYNFELWFSQEATSFGSGFGYNTYMAIPHFLGMADRTGGVYERAGGSIGNVFTAFRAVIEDFGIIGGLLFGFLKGGMTQFFYRKTKRVSPTKGFISQIVLFGEYFWGLYSFIVSPWIYTSYFLMPLGLLFFLAFFNISIGMRIKLHVTK